MPDGRQVLVAVYGASQVLMAVMFILVIVFRPGGIMGGKEIEFKRLMFWSKQNREGDRNKEKSFDPQLLSMDFYSQMVYMSAIATSGIARDRLIYRSARLPFVSSRFFRKVDFVARMFNHDYPQACRIVGEKTKKNPLEVLDTALRNAGPNLEVKPRRV